MVQTALAHKSDSVSMSIGAGMPAGTEDLTINDDKRTIKRGLDYGLSSFIDDSALTLAKLSAHDPWSNA